MDQARSTLQHRLSVLRILLPVGFAVIAILYQLLLAQWVLDLFGEEAHFGVEIIFYATVGPLLAFWVLTQIGRWLEEKEHFEHQARMSERRLASITEASVDAILSLDTSGRIASWNNGAELLFGFSKEEILGRPLSDLFGSEKGAAIELQWLLETVQRAGYLRGHEVSCMDARDREIIVELTATDLKDPEGSSVGTSVILRDITSRKQREEEIRQLNLTLNQQVEERTQQLAEKVEALAHANSELQKVDQMRAEFVSLVSHQLRAPLTNMRGAVERMQNGCGVINTTCSRMFTILDEQVLRLDRLVEGVLNISRLEGGELVVQKEPTSVLPVVKQIVEQTRARSGERPIHLPLKPGLPLVYTDRQHLSEILTNLLDNADKYSPPGSEVSIDVRANETEVVLSVHDAGPGLSENDLSRVFEKYYRADGSDSQTAYGYGLGLYVCRSLVETLGGRIWAENHPDGGAVFSFSLPVWRGENG